MSPTLTDTARKRIVVIGGGFAGLSFIKKLDLENFDVTLIDRNNYHSFPPLFYQVASAGLDAASICFPLRRELRKRSKAGNLRFNMDEVKQIDSSRQIVKTGQEEVPYDILIIAAGTTNNFFGMTQLEKTVYTLKSTAQSLRCRNDILDRLERAAIEKEPVKRAELLNFVVIGGGPTGVEIAGALGEMKRYVLPREYPTIAQEEVKITLIEGSDRLLKTMREGASKLAEEYLKSLMVDPVLNTQVRDFSQGVVTLGDGRTLRASMVIWTAGVRGTPFDFVGEAQPVVGPGNRMVIDGQCRVKGLPGNVYALGDIGLMNGGEDPEFPHGHPQLAQVAIQQGRMVADNLSAPNREPRQFVYHDKGSMATVGRNRAVVDLKKTQFGGFAAWLVWMFIHLISILGMRNKITVLVNWIWAYFNYSTSLRLLIHPSRWPERSRWKD